MPSFLGSIKLKFENLFLFAIYLRLSNKKMIEEVNFLQGPGKTKKLPKILSYSKFDDATKDNDVINFLWRQS